MSELKSTLYKVALLPSVISAALAGCNGEPIGQGELAEAEGINQPPYFISVSGWEIHESDETLPFYVARALDDDGDEIAFSLSPDNYDGRFFHMDAITGEMRFKAAPDYEKPQDKDKDNRYDITLVASDGKGGKDEFEVSVWVKDESYEGPPIDNMGPFFPVQEVTIDVSYDATGVIYTAEAFDFDGDPMMFSLNFAGIGLDAYSMNPVTGELSLLQKPDPEHEGDTVVLVVSDGKTTESHGALHIRYVEGDVPPPSTSNPHAPMITSASTAFLTGDVGTDAFYTATAEDVDGDGVTFSLRESFGASHLFKIDAKSGAVGFIETPDFASLTEVYAESLELVIEADDGRGKTGYGALRVYLNYEGEAISNPHTPVVTSASMVEVNEGIGTDAFYKATAKDADGDNVTFFIHDGFGASHRFEIDPITGDLRFVEAPDFAALREAYGESLELVVGVDDGLGKKGYGALRVQLTPVE